MRTDPSMFLTSILPSALGRYGTYLDRGDDETEVKTGARGDFKSRSAVMVWLLRPPTTLVTSSPLNIVAVDVRTLARRGVGIECRRLVCFGLGGATNGGCHGCRPVTTFQLQSNRNFRGELTSARREKMTHIVTFPRAPVTDVTRDPQIASS